jgi:polyphosphate kinase
VTITTERYINREISWLGFNQRVLDQAFDANNPLLERLKFLAIASSNLDEFFMVRVGSLKLAADKGSAVTDVTGLTAQEQLQLVRDKILEQTQLIYGCLLDELEPLLKEQHIRRLTAGDLMGQSQKFLDTYFDNELLPIISPISVSCANDFPMLRGKRMCLCVRMKNNSTTRLDQAIIESSGVPLSDTRYVVIPFPANVARIIPLPAKTGYEFILLEDLLATQLHKLLPDQEVIEWSPLRVIRNADAELDEDTDDFMLEVLELINLRQNSPCVRLEVAESASGDMVRFLRACVGALEIDTYRARGPLDLSAFSQVAQSVHWADLKDVPWPPRPVPDFDHGKDIFAVIAAGDRLVLHPYQSFDPVIELLQQAANDRDVVAIKQTLYRTARESKVVDALIQARNNGKHVTAVVELKARFDEQRNIQWARRMEAAGVDVIYGVSGLKTHAKMLLVVRREKRGMVRYVHFGTGNYNESTAQLYSDVSLFTADQQLGLDTVHAFNAITGLSVPQPLEKLALAPINLRSTLSSLIAVERHNAKNGLPAEIVAKLNSVVDAKIIDELYEASQAGVKIRLNVRGICCLRPGVKGLSENISVVSIVDRFLEHSRIIMFHHGGEKRLYLTSADWMGRNLDRRIELLVPVEDRECRQRLMDTLEAYFADNTHAYRMAADGHYEKVAGKRKSLVRSQEVLYRAAEEIEQNATEPSTTVFRELKTER